MIRSTFRLASKRDWDGIKRGIKPIYTAVNAGAARAVLDELAGQWGQRYPAIIRRERPTVCVSDRGIGHGVGIRPSK